MASLLTVSLGALGGDRIQAQTLPRSLISCPAEQQTKTELYFGLSKPDGAIVSPLAWRTFLQRTVTPRFQEGLTVIDALGQYRNQAGQIVTEPSKLVILIHSSTPEKEQAIAELIQVYKQTFQQESVLRVSHCVNVSFE